MTEPAETRAGAVRRLARSPAAGRRREVLLWALVGLAAAPPRQHTEAQTAPPVARSAIVFIGDGVDEQQLTLGRNYLHGAAGTLRFEGLEHRASARVLTVREDDPERPEYVGDSASGGTALASGVVTSLGRIGTRAGSDQDVPTLLELARQRGKKVGVVATSSLTDATPASFYAHVAFRFCEGPEDMKGARGGLLPSCPADDAAAGGPGSIAEQLARSGLDVALGGGAGTFAQRTVAGESVLALAERSGFRVVTTREELLAVPAGRVLGLFAPSHLPVLWQGEGGARALPPTPDADGGVEEPPRFGCEPSPSFGETPTLALLTRRALELLSTAEPGFVLMVESASIDKRSHAADPCGEIGEIRQLEDAVQVGLEYAASHPDTLLVVASDHGHAAQIVPYPSMFARLGSARDPRSPGKLALIETPEGGAMAVSYATSDGFYEEHTGTSVPIFGQGPGAEALTGMIDQSAVFEIVRSALGLSLPAPVGEDTDRDWGDRD